MNIFEMENRDEILLLLMNFYNINNNYTDKDLEEFIKENSALQDIDIDEISHMLEEIVDYLDSEADMEEDEYVDEDVPFKDNDDLILRKVTFTGKDIVEGVKNIDYRKGLSRSYRYIQRNIKNGINYIIKKVIQLVVFIINKEPNLDKQILLYKRMVQKELDKTRGLLMEAECERRGELEKDIIRLTKSQGIIPSISLDNKLKFALISMIYDIRILIVFIVLSVVISKIAIVLNGYTKFLHYTLPFILIFLSIYYLIITPRIKKKVAGSLDLRNFMWDEFPYGSGLIQAFNNIGKSNYSMGNYLDNLDFGDMDLNEMERLIIGEERHRSLSFANEYEKALKEWNNKHFKEGDINPLPIEKKDKNEYITKFSFQVPIELDLDVVEKKIPEYSRHCGKTILHDEKSIKDSKITLFLEEKELPTMVKFDESKIDKSSDTRVYVGEAFDGSVYLDFNENPHMLIGGSTRCGKGVTQNVILTQLTQKGEVIIMDLSTKAGADYNYYKEKGYRIVTQLEETLDFFKGLQEEARIRMEIFRDHGKNKLSAYNKVVSEEDKIYRKFIIIDEYASLKRVDKEDENEAKEIEKTIIALGEQAGAVGIHIIIATQNAKATIIDTELRNNLLLRVVGRCADKNASNVFLENDFASVKREVPLVKSHEAGRFIVYGANTKDRLAMNEHFVVQVPFMEFAGDNAEEHIGKYGYLVEEPKLSKIIERYKKGEVREQPIETNRQIHNTLEEKTAEDYL